ncbi:hypothetical protein F4861DRAFT_473570 [Xylaria intraflava]|nr:hypothetical protein F4861DRAFT_473570 [Xylaria intraflava]
MSVAYPAGIHSPSMSRPQVGIERLPTRRMSNEPRESMNCKSCRKRKIKCNRLRPSCEACQVFQCQCVYDAVPKKRGPKTDVLEALLKRVDGLEAQLKDRKRALGEAPAAGETQSLKVEAAEDNTAEPSGSDSTTAIPTETSEPRPKRVAVDLTRRRDSGCDGTLYSPDTTNEQPPAIRPQALLDIYFTRLHAKPYHILDEQFVRQRLRLNQLPLYLVHAIYAVSARYTLHPNGYQAAVKLGEDFASKSRKGIDIDEPAVDTLQALLLLVIAYIATGNGKKAYMLLANAVGMAMALELHREADTNAPVSALEREMRRRLFWSCYLLDRFMACGSKRPCLIGDKTIFLRLPFWFPTPGGLPIEGEFFQSSSNLPSLHGGSRKFQGGSAMLIDISRILGVTNRYLAAGGVKSDSHFPWHTLSSLSKIRQDLDIWASGTDDVFSSLDALFGHPECTVLVLSKLIYHLIYCLIYRPFLPVDLAELSVTGQHQSWQIEATNMCFLHANAITELVELGKQTGSTEWPAFVGYCICTAGTVHIHGAHYNRAGLRGGDMGTFAASGDFLTREMQQLSELRYVWASVQHQKDTLQNVYNAHIELVKRLAANSMHYSPTFNLEDFFSRYANVISPGGEPFNFDASNLSLMDVSIDFAAETYTGQELYSSRDNNEPDRPNLKRKHAASVSVSRSELGNTQLGVGINGSMPASRPVPPASLRRFSLPVESPSLAMLRASPSIPTNSEAQEANQPREPVVNSPAKTMMPATPGYTDTPAQQSEQTPGFPSNSFATPRSLSVPNQGVENNGAGFGSYDPMFGGVLTNTFPSPAPWQAEEDNADDPLADAQTDAPTVLTPGLPNHDGSPTAATTEEKDPFLSLLEQLAENENALGQGNELDFLISVARS